MENPLNLVPVELQELFEEKIVLQNNSYHYVFVIKDSFYGLLYNNTLGFKDEINDCFKFVKFEDPAHLAKEKYISLVRYSLLSLSECHLNNKIQELNCDTIVRYYFLKKESFDDMIKNLKNPELLIFNLELIKNWFIN